MSKIAENNTTSLDQILDAKYGKRGKAKREIWEQEFLSFQLGVLLEEAREIFFLIALLKLKKLQVSEYQKCLDLDNL